MAQFYRDITAYQEIHHFATRKCFEEVKEAIRKLESLLEAQAGRLQPGGTTTIINNLAGSNTAHYSMPIVIDPSMQLFPDGMPIQFTSAVRIKRCFMDCDRGTPALAPTSFTLQNSLSSPSSAGTVTFATGATYAQSTTLGVLIGLGQMLYIKAPTVLNDVQRINNIHLEYEPL